MNEEIQKALSDFKKETTHKVAFYSKDHQIWFKNSTTGREYPLPVALIEKVTENDESSEAHRIAKQDLKRYVEATRS